MKNKRGLVALAIVTFCLGISEFGMMGVLEAVASGLNISIVKAGDFITAYSLGVAVGSPGLIFLRRWPLKRILLLLTTILLIGNVCAALSPGYLTLLISRFISGLPHGAYFGAAAIVAERLVPDGRKAQAVAIMVGGMTVANVVGVPMATFLADAIDWRLAFGVIAICATVALFTIHMEVPYISPLPDSGIKGQFRFLRNIQPWLLYAGVFFGQASVYCWLSYINPIMLQVAHFPAAGMTWVMVVVGLGMVFGNAIAGKLADRYHASLVSAITAFSLIFIMGAIYLFAADKLISILLAFIASGALFAIGGPLQYLIVKYSRGGEMLGAAGIQIAFNVSNAMSAYLGGMAIHAGLGISSPALIGIPFAAVGAAALFILYFRYSRK